MRKLCKKRRELNESLPFITPKALDEAVEWVQKGACARFDESIDIAACLSVDPRKANQIVRGSVLLPHGTGRTVRVAVFAQGEKAEAALESGADEVGFEDLAAKVKAGYLNFDVVIASPDAMRVVGQLGQILGPRGLMPTPRVGTVTQDVALAVREAKFGKIQYKTDRVGIVHAPVGRASFSADKLKENITVFMDAIIKAKPQVVKGNYIARVFLSSTMGRSIRVDQVLSF